MDKELTLNLLRGASAMLVISVILGALAIVLVTIGNLLGFLIGMFACTFLLGSIITILGYYIIKFRR